MRVVGLEFYFTLACVAEQIALAGIVGGFAAGLPFDPCGQCVRIRAGDATLAELLCPLSSLFAPLFFVLMELRVDIPGLLAPTTFLVAAGLTLAGAAGKLASSPESSHALSIDSLSASE